MVRNDGGPAFPTNSDQHDVSSCGLSIRDYFAAHAPPPPKWWLDSYPDCFSKADRLQLPAEHWSQWAFVYADAMLAERQKGDD